VKNQKYPSKVARKYFYLQIMRRLVNSLLLKLHGIIFYHQHTSLAN